VKIEQISRIFKVSMCSVYKWVANYLADGLPALEAKSRRTALPFVYKTAETTDDYID